jgi:hypothetical protein
MVGSGFCPFGWTSLGRFLVKQRIGKPKKMKIGIAWLMNTITFTLAKH